MITAASPLTAEAEKTLRQQNEELSFLIDAAPGVLYICKPEGDFAATFISPSVKAQLDYDPGDFTGDAGFWAGHIHPEDKEQVFAGLGSLFERDCHTHEYRFLHADGSYHWMHDQMSLLRDSDGKPERIVGFWNDITERKKAEETLQRQNEELRKRDNQLKDQNERFTAALDNMSQGLCMFDGEQRLIVCNERYGSLYGLSIELLKPGILFRQILEYRIANSIYAGENPEEYIQERCAAVAEGKASTKIQELADGRIIAIAHQPMPDGGWLATHEDITELYRIEAKMAHMAHHDALTDLPNRVLLRERIEDELKRAKRGETFALLCLDLDQFKNVNDTLGHPAGDELLKSVGERLRSCVRETNLVARLGGDEFAVIQVGIEQRGDIAVLARRICEAINVPFNIENHEVFIDTSIGIAIAPDDGTDPDELLKKADMALFKAKAEGTGIFCFFEPELETNLKMRHALGLDLRKALLNDELEVQYQPLIDLDENKVSGFEALLRWIHPEHGVVPPDTFIPLAEQMGLINNIGEWVLRQACVNAATWPGDLKIAANISPVQIRKLNFVQTVISALAGSGLPASRLELEITESVLLLDDEMILTKLHNLQDLGVRISMDDFGTGYSSLSYLTSFPFHKIKIDASFVSGLCEGDENAGIVQAIVGVASNLGMMTTAEGVETEGQLEILRREGCTEAQGYLFSKPMPAGEIPDFLSKDPGRSDTMVSAA
ncbi:MAG: EAL domain-containing protein [Hyphomicrobiales bacterium]|nr:EAL domain-containing protein [Hyphomicrobiales bacterium]